MKSLNYLPDHPLWHIYYSGMDTYDTDVDSLHRFNEKYTCKGCHNMLDNIESIPDITIAQKIPENLDMAYIGGVNFGVLSERLKYELGESITSQFNFGNIYIARSPTPLHHQMYAGKGKLTFLRAEKPYLMDGKPIETRTCPVCNRVLYGGLGKRYLLSEDITTDSPVLWSNYGGFIIDEATKDRLKKLKLRGVRFEKIMVLKSS